MQILVLIIDKPTLTYMKYIQHIQHGNMQHLQQVSTHQALFLSQKKYF